MKDTTATGATKKQMFFQPTSVTLRVCSCRYGIFERVILLPGDLSHEYERGGIATAANALVRSLLDQDWEGKRMPTRADHITTALLAKDAKRRDGVECMDNAKNERKGRKK